MPALDAYSVLCTRAADGIREVGAFGAPEQWRFEWEAGLARPPILACVWLAGLKPVLAGWL